MPWASLCSAKHKLTKAWGRGDRRPFPLLIRRKHGRQEDRRRDRRYRRSGRRARARAILDDPSGEFALRAVTRDPGKDAARALADRGAEVVQADLDDEASLRSAFDGAYGAYCLTNFWEHFNGEMETAQGGNLARAAAAAGVQHAIWSTFEDTRKSIPLDDDRMPTLQEKYKVVHFDAKADADHYFTDAGVPTTFLLTSF